MSQPSLYNAGFDIFVDNVKQNIRDSKEQKAFDAFLKGNGSAEAARDSASALSDDAGKKYGDKDIGGKISIEKSMIKTILGNIQNFITVGDFVLKKAPESVGVAWFAVSLALTAIQNNYALYSLFGAGLTDITEMMVTIRHYDRMFDERLKPGFKDSDMLKKLFSEISNTYAAMLDFAFHVQRHLSGSGWARVRHGFKDFFNAEAPKFQTKQNEMRSRKAKVIEASDAAFKEKTIQQFGDVQDVVKQNVDGLKSFQQSSEEFYHAQLEMQSDIQKTLKEIKAATKPRTRWDWALQDFEKNKSKLKALENSMTPMFEALDTKLDGTCTWLQEHPTYIEWFTNTRNSVLCVTGSEGAGKSIVLASAVNTIDEVVDHASSVVLYLSCDMGISGEMGKDSPSSLTRISNTLIYQIYELATLDESKPALLEACNNVFTNPKLESAPKLTRGTKPDDTLPDLSEALVRLSSELEKQVIIVLDEIDCMAENDQDDLYEKLTRDLPKQTTTESSSNRVRVLAGCRAGSGSRFYARMRTTGAIVNVDDFNRDDIKLQLSLELDRFTTWNDGDKEEAQAKILQQTGPLYKYLVDVAIPFLREPYQGALSIRLQDLPEGMNEAYDRALRGKASNYLELLRNALSWLLFAARPLRVTEIMEAYSGTFLGEPSEEQMQLVKYQQSWSTDTSELQVSQLKLAGEPFLEVFENDDVGDTEFWVELKNSSQVQQFCIRHDDEDAVKTPDCDVLCSKCKGKIHTAHHLSFTEKDGHLDLAIACVRHLCNPIFWQRYYRWPDRTIETSGSMGAGTGDDTKQIKVTESATDGQSLDTMESTIPEPATDDRTQGEMEITLSEPSEAFAPQVSDGGEIDEQPDEKGHDTDDSMDEEDYGDFNFKRRSPSAVEEPGDDYTTDYFNSLFRYEMGFWHYHVRKAESLWSREERQVENRWQILMALLDRLAFKCPIQFAKCQAIVFGQTGMDPEQGAVYEQEPWLPLNVAALLNLTSWTEHLVAKGCDIHGKSADRTPLQAAMRGDAGLATLRVLLENGANPNEDSETRMPAFHSLFWSDPEADIVSLFLRHNAKRQMIDQYNGMSVMHYLAEGSTRSETFELLFSGKDRDQWPNINACDTQANNQTPLQFLLQRRDVPHELLRAFLEKGAKVNAEDLESKRPLQDASIWGDIGVMEIILPLVTDIDDPDKHGRTALHQAVWNGHTRCIELLLKHHANSEVLDRHDRTPLFFACLGKSVETANVILNSMCLGDGSSVLKINKATKRGRTPLRQAAGNGFLDVVRRILALFREHGGEEAAASVNRADDRKGWTALHYASFRGEADVVRLLLAEKCTNAGLPDKNNDTALQLACSQWVLSAQEDFEIIISMLIDREPDAAINDAELLSAAAANGSKPILEKLHGLKAVLNRPDRYGWSPLMVAQRWGHSAAEDFLAKVGASPLQWETTAPNIELSAGKLGVKFKSREKQNCVTTDLPLPAGHKKFYYEITISNVNAVDGLPFPSLAIGFSTHPATAIEFAGWPPVDRAPHAQSWAYHGDDGAFAASDGRFEINDDRRYGHGSTVGCGVDFDTGTMWFTRGKERLKTEDFFKDVRGRLFPIVASHAQVEIETNFGAKDFVWQGETSTGASSGIQNGQDEEAKVNAIKSKTLEVDVPEVAASL